MVVRGTVKMTISLNVWDLETDAVEINEYNKITITNPDKFFMDWIEAWDDGCGEMLGAFNETEDLDEVFYRRK